MRITDGRSSGDLAMSTWTRSGRRLATACRRHSPPSPAHRMAPGCHRSNRRADMANRSPARPTAHRRAGARQAVFITAAGEDENRKPGNHEQERTRETHDEPPWGAEPLGSAHGVARRRRRAPRPMGGHRTEEPIGSTAIGSRHGRPGPRPGLAPLLAGRVSASQPPFQAEPRALSFTVIACRITRFSGVPRAGSRARGRQAAGRAHAGVRPLIPCVQSPGLSPG
jgi:hypothetical protein